jgi:hypothetical protein
MRDKWALEEQPWNRAPPCSTAPCSAPTSRKIGRDNARRPFFSITEIQVPRASPWILILPGPSQSRASEAALADLDQVQPVG